MAVEIKSIVSPNELTTIAFIAALLAARRVYQKPIKRYEHKPMPSQPTINIRKLSAATNINIKNSNKHT